MQDIDRMIEEALDGEEQALFRETAREPGFFEQAFGLLWGPNGWVFGVRSRLCMSGTRRQ